MARGFSTTGRPMPTATAHGALSQHGAQGRLREDCAARWKVRQVRPRLGHARPADRVRDAQASRHQRFSYDRSTRAARALQGARAFLARPPARAARADGKLRTIRPAVSHDRSVVRSDDRQRARRPCRETSDLQGIAFDALVHPRRNGARRGRDRVRATRLAVDLRPLHGKRRTARTNTEGFLSVSSAGAPAGQSLFPHLDDDAVDAAGERRHRIAPRRRLWPLSRRRRGRHRRRSARGKSPWGAFRAGGADRPRSRRSARRSRRAPSLHGPRFGDRVSRVCRSGDGNGRRSHGAGPRRRRLRYRHEIRIADPQSG